MRVNACNGLITATMLQQIGVKSPHNDRVLETIALGSASGQLHRCGQSLQNIPYRPAHGLLLASAQSEKIQALLCSSSYRVLCPDSTATGSMCSRQLGLNCRDYSLFGYFCSLENLPDSAASVREQGGNEM